MTRRAGAWRRLWHPADARRDWTGGAGGRVFEIVAMPVVIATGAALRVALADCLVREARLTDGASQSYRLQESSHENVVAHGDSGEGISDCCCKQGPPLIGSALTRWQIRAATYQGMPGMPAFRGRLSDAEIKAVAAYVQRLAAELPPE